MEKHERFTVSISFTVCDGLKDKVLEEIREVINQTTKTLDHASDVKVKVHHESIE
ncbi:MAG: hypothetical protein ACREBR_04580 [bacterium]